LASEFDETPKTRENPIFCNFLVILSQMNDDLKIPPNPYQPSNSEPAPKQEPVIEAQPEPVVAPSAAEKIQDSVDSATHRTTMPAADELLPEMPEASMSRVVIQIALYGLGFIALIAAFVMYGWPMLDELLSGEKTTTERQVERVSEEEVVLTEPTENLEPVEVIRTTTVSPVTDWKDLNTPAFVTSEVLTQISTAGYELKSSDALQEFLFIIPTADLSATFTLESKFFEGDRGAFVVHELVPTTDYTAAAETAKEQLTKRGFEIQEAAFGSDSFYFYDGKVAITVLPLAGRMVAFSYLADNFSILRPLIEELVELSD